MIEQLNRSDAKARADRYFWPELPCIDGHRAHRFVANGRCVECWFQEMHGRPLTDDDLIKGKMKADAKRDRRAFVNVSKHPRGASGFPTADARSLEAARKAAIKRLWQNARNHARVRGIRFDVRASEFELHRECPVLGIALIYLAASTRSDYDSYAVLERIDLNRGYEVGNVEVISTRASRLRGNTTCAEIAMISKFFFESGCDAQQKVGSGSS